MTVTDSPSLGYEVARHIPTDPPLTSSMEKWRPWRAPRLTENGRTFKPKRHAPGDTILIEIHDGQNWARVKAQVWSDGPRRGTRWVVRDGKAYLVTIWGTS